MTDQTALDPHTPAALVVAHPGHELSLHGWLESVRPRVFVLTDGSGRGGRSRLGSTERLLQRIGAAPGSLFGALSDRRLYEALVGGEASFFLDLAEKLAAAFVSGGIGTVVADPAEGYNPGHDICRLVADAAVRAAAAQERAATSWDFALTQPAAADPPGAVRLVLDDAALARKRAAADAHPEMRSEVEAALARAGLESFRVETLRPVDPRGESLPFRERGAHLRGVRRASRRGGTLRARDPIPRAHPGRGRSSRCGAARRAPARSARLRRQNRVQVRLSEAVLLAAELSAFYAWR